MKALRHLFSQWIYDPIADAIQRYQRRRVPMKFVWFVWRQYLLYAIVVIVGGTLFFILEETFRLGNTGFRTKTLWDWMELLVIPFVLALGGYLLNRSEKNIERQSLEERALLERGIATARQQEAALQGYLDRMADLLLKEKLQTTEIEEVRNVARIRTLTVLRGLDATRKGFVLLFLQEASLISKQNTIVDLTGADLSGADLSNTSLRGANLSHTNLNNALLTRTSLRDADLSGAHLNNADLSDAHLLNANLSNADLSDAFLRYTRLYKANLSDANLHNVNMNTALLSSANLRAANLRGVNLSNMNLSNDVDLSSAILDGADLSNANLTKVYLDHAHLRDANLSEAKLQFADLRHADLLEANLRGADLRDSNLSNADLRWATLRDANLQGANVSNEQLATVRALWGATMPDGTKHD